MILYNYLIKKEIDTIPQLLDMSFRFNPHVKVISGTPVANCLVIAVVKETFRYPNVFFYNRLYRNSLFRNFIMESGINRRDRNEKEYI